MTKYGFIPSDSLLQFKFNLFKDDEIKLCFDLNFPYITPYFCYEKNITNKNVDFGIWFQYPKCRLYTVNLK